VAKALFVIDLIKPSAKAEGNLCEIRFEESLLPFTLVNGFIGAKCMGF